MEKANFFWKGELTKVEIASIKSFINNGFDVNLWSYENHYVEGASSKDANDIIKEGTLEAKQNNELWGITTTTSLSDLFRYKVLSENEGWWFDCDCFCLKNCFNFKLLRENVGKNKIVVGNEGVTANSAVMYANGAVMYLDKQTASDLFKKAIDILEKNDWVLPKWGMIGPLLIDDYVKQNNLLDHVVTRDYFYEIGYDETALFYSEETFTSTMRRIKNSYITHVWDSFLNYHGVDKNNPPKNSVLDYLVNINR